MKEIKPIEKKLQENFELCMKMKYFGQGTNAKHSYSQLALSHSW